MKEEERRIILTKLDSLFQTYETQFDTILKQMAQETIQDDFFEELYEILYDFLYDEKKLLARVSKLMEMKVSQTIDKIDEN